jgi:hypothetical protein
MLDVAIYLHDVAGLAWDDLLRRCHLACTFEEPQDLRTRVKVRDCLYAGFEMTVKNPKFRVWIGDVSEPYVTSEVVACKRIGREV